MLPPLPRASERVFDWMDAKARKIVDARVRTQVEKARRRGSKSARVVLEDLDLLLNR